MSGPNTGLVRSVFLDDDDPSITYRGPWTKYKNDFADYREFGPVYKGSQHRLSGDRGGVVFYFQGTGSIFILGTSDPRNNSGTLDPSFSCWLDGVNVPTERPLSIPINLWPLCSTNATTTGDHVFELEAESNEADFYVDQIFYTPDFNSPPEGPNTVGIFQDDLAVRYLEGTWEGGVTGMGTTEAGAKMSITFTGNSARWIGSVPKDQPRQNSTASYSLNGGPQITFAVPGLYGAPLPRYGQPFFEVEDLGPGTHELVVTYQGDSAPLMFNYLQVEGGDIVQSALIREDNPDGDGSEPKPIGAIVGGAVGGAVFLVALSIFAFCLWRRRRKQQPTADIPVPRPQAQYRPPVHSTFQAEPLFLTGQSPPTSLHSMSATATGNSTFPQQTRPQPMDYMVQPSTTTMSSYPSGFSFNSSPTSQSDSRPITMLAPATMSVSYEHQGPSFSRPPEPMP